MGKVTCECDLEGAVAHYLDAGWMSSSKLSGDAFSEDPDGIPSNTSIRFHELEYSGVVDSRFKIIIDIYQDYVSDRNVYTGQEGCCRSTWFGWHGSRHVASTVQG